MRYSNLNKRAMSGKKTLRHKTLFMLAHSILIPSGYLNTQHLHAHTRASLLKRILVAPLVSIVTKAKIHQAKGEKIIGPQGG